MTHRRTFVLLFAAALAGACGSAPQVHPDLAPRREALVAAMRAAAAAPVPRPPLFYIDQAWGNWRMGHVVAIDGPMIAIRLEDPTLRGWTWDPDRFDVAQISGVPGGLSVAQSAIKGHGILVARFDDLLLCRYVDSATDLNPDPPFVQDHAGFDGNLSARVQHAVTDGTAEWIPAAPVR